MRRFPTSLTVALAVLLLGSGTALAQNRSRNLPPGLEDLPIGLAPHEKPVTSGGSYRATSPPTGPVRAAAEWDVSQGVFCLWDNASLMKELASDNTLYVITTNSTWWNNWLSTNGVNMSNVQYLNKSTNTWWVRDYGPWFIWDGNQDFGLVDNVYNRPRPLDDTVPAAISSAYGVPYYGMDVIHTGGNFYADGYGNGWSSTLVYSENSMSDAQVNQNMSDFVGIARYIARDLKYDIQHIDTFGKPLAPDRLLWGSFPVGTTPWAWSEGALKHYETLQSPYGWPYKIFRIPLFSYSSSWTAYINSLQSNHKFILPMYNTGNDATAEAIYEAAAPGYDAVLVNAAGTQWGDSVHCRSRNFMDGDQVRIYPQPHWELTDENLTGYPVAAEVIPNNSTSLNGNPLIYWSTTGGAPFTTLAMSPTGQPHEYAATIPAQPHGTTVSYYYHAQDNAGNVRRFPYTALSGGLFTIEVTPDDEGPELEHAAIHSARLADWPLEVDCIAIDNAGIPDVTLEYRINGVPMPTIAMVQDTGTFRFATTFVGGAGVGDQIDYRVVATDDALTPNVSAAPAFGWNSFVVDNVKKVLVIELDNTPDSGERWVEACDDLGLTAEFTDTWPSVPSNYEALVICLGMTPTHQSLTSGQANALASYLSGGGSAYMEGGQAWYSSTGASTYRPWFGISSASSGSNITGNLTGVTGAATQGMTFDLEGEYTGADHLNLAGGAASSIRYGSYNKAVTYATGNARTVASSFQFGGLVDAAAPSHAKRLAAYWLDHLGMGIDLVVSSADDDPMHARVTLEGDPGARYVIFHSPAPGYMPRGPLGVLLIESSRMRILQSGALPPSGELELDITVGFSTALFGQEIYYQALVEDKTGGGAYLSNRDRLTPGL